jgi:hypothetical protein
MYLSLKGKIDTIIESGLYILSDKEYEGECDILMDECISSYYNQSISGREYFKLMELLGISKSEADDYLLKQRLQI